MQQRKAMRAMKPSTVYPLIALAFLALLFLSSDPKVGRSHRRHGPARRIVVRTKGLFPGRHRAAAFDPIVAEHEQRREERHWEEHQHQRQDGHAMPMQPQPDFFDPNDPDYFADEDYLNDDDHFNVHDRLLSLFPLIDTNHDGTISLRELEDWHVQQGLKAVRHRSDWDFRAHDADKDGLVTFAEYLPEVRPEQIANSSLEHGSARWWKEQFDLADEDGDGALNPDEFNSFLNPEDSTNPKLRAWLRKQEILDHDTDEDGKLSWAEFDKTLYAALSEIGKDDTSSGSHRVLMSRLKFKSLDANQDGYLTEDELEPVMDLLHPGEAFYAKQQAEQLMEQVDENRDGVLTLDEMQRHPYAFYNTIIDDGDYEYSHIEL